MPGPLHGYRILDLTSVFLGPFATQILGDNGADVIKVEAPEGDITRDIQPARNRGMGAVLLNANRSKRAIVLDLKKPDGRDALLRLAETADVLVHSVRPKAMERLGLGYADICRVNPTVVYAGVLGFRPGGPYSDKAAYDDIIQGLSGLVATQAFTTGEPRYVPGSVVDKIVGIHLVYAITMALLHRERTGEGQQVEVPMLECMTGFNLLEHAAGMLFDPPMGEPGYARARTPYRRPYKTSDGYVCMLPYTTRHWQNFFRLIGREDMVEDPRVTDPATRSQSVDDLYRMVADAVEGWTTKDLIAALDGADIPAGPVNELAGVYDDPHLKATGFFRHVEHPTEGSLVLTDVPVGFSKSPGEIGRHAPCLGEHSVELLREAGYSAEEIDRMIGDGVTVDGGA
jgi:crotonobetainyl-CoA:carnitine CoA-transferase CaiB-like acyl-CoA transferase